MRVQPTEKSHAENQAVLPSAWGPTPPLKSGFCCVSVMKRLHPNGKTWMLPNIKKLCSTQNCLLLSTAHCACGTFVEENQSAHPEAACDTSVVCGSRSLHESHWKWDPGPQLRSMERLKSLFSLSSPVVRTWGYFFIHSHLKKLKLAAEVSGVSTHSVGYIAYR